MSRKRRQGQARTAGEWATLAASVVIVGGLLALAGLPYLQARPPASIVATPRFAEVRQESGTYYLPVDIENTGMEAAEDVVIRFTVRDGQREEVAEVTVRILSGGETQEAVVAFRIRPAPGNVEAAVASYLRP